MNTKHTKVNNNTRKLILTTTPQIILYNIWQSRSNTKYDKITITTKTIINKISKQIEIIITILTFAIFNKLFCINSDINQIISALKTK